MEKVPELALKTCPECGGKYSFVHVCEPIFFVRFEDQETTEAVRVFTHTPQSAAMEFAQDKHAARDCDSLNPQTVIVIDNRNHQEHRFTVRVVELYPVFAVVHESTEDL